MGQLFPKQHRLLLPSEYRLVFNARQRLSTDFFLLFYKQTQEPHARLGLAISKKAIRSAAKRNHLKRMAREAFRCAHWPICLDIVVVAKKGVDASDKRALRIVFDHAWVRLLRRHPP